MQCKQCGGSMEGDGYTVPYHCETLDISDSGNEPDCDPIYCPPEAQEPVLTELLNLWQTNLATVEAALKVMDNYDKTHYCLEFMSGDDGQWKLLKIANDLRTLIAIFTAIKHTYHPEA